MAECKHGKEVGGYSGPTVPMAAPFFTCTCCRQVTFYIASSSHTYDSGSGEWHGSSTVPSTEFCWECGGRTVVKEY